MPIVDSHQKVAREDRSARIEVSHSVDLAGLPARARARVGRAVRGMRFERMDPYGSGS